MTRFDDFDKQFDDHFRSTKRVAVIGGVISLVLTFGVLGFAGWVIVAILRHFGIV